METTASQLTPAGQSPALARATGSAVCGNCGKPLSEHYHENEEYCFKNTTGDIFTDDPSATLLANWLEGWNPTLHASLVTHWKREHGHTPNKQ